VCTVTFLPLENSTVVTANRDESPARAARGLTTHLNAAQQHFHVAKEPIYGGTNMAIGDDGTVYVLLNGAFEPHPFGRKYEMSRGIMVLRSLNYNNLSAFAEDFDFEKTEPFTLLRFGKSIEEIRWDGTVLHQAAFSHKFPNIWASAQLYSREAIENRQLWFANLLKGNPDSEDVLDFHQNGGNGDTANDMVMNRGGMVRTVSVTQIVSSEAGTAVSHLDLLSGSRQKPTISKR